MRGSQPKPKSLSRVAASPYHAFSRLTMYLSKLRPPARSRAMAHDVAAERADSRRRTPASADSRAAGRRASGCRSIPESTRVRAARACRRRAGRRCRAAVAESRRTRTICTPTECCVSRRRSRSSRCGPDRSTRCSDRRSRETDRAECRRRARPSPACSARSGARDADTPSADARSVGSRRGRPSSSQLELPASSCRRRRRRRCQPEKRPSRSSGPWKSSRTSTDAFV